MNSDGVFFIFFLVNTNLNSVLQDFGFHWVSKKDQFSSMADHYSHASIMCLSSVNLAKVTEAVNCTCFSANKGIIFLLKKRHPYETRGGCQEVVI